MSGSGYGMLLWLWIILAPAVAFVLLSGDFRRDPPRRPFE